MDKFTATSEVRSRVQVSQGNPIIKDETEIQKYNDVCDLLPRYCLCRLELRVDDFFVSFGRKEKRFKYVKCADVKWLECKIKTLRENLDYAIGQNVELFTETRANGIVNSIGYALQQDTTVIQSGAEVIITSEMLTYRVNLNRFPLPQRVKIDKLLAIRRLEDLLKKQK